MVLPYFIHHVPYWCRVICLCALSSGGILLVATTRSIASGGSITGKLFGVALSSLSAGVGEYSFLAMTHFYGHASLAAWGTGTGLAGLVGAGLFFLFTSIIGLTVKTSLLISALLPFVMVIAFFIILPREAMYGKKMPGEYEAIAQEEHETRHGDEADETQIGPADSTRIAKAYASPLRNHQHGGTTVSGNVRLVASLLLPYILPIILVYLGEYTINQGVAPTLLFPLSETPFSRYRDFYPFYNLLYQTGVLIARSSIAVVRINSLYVPSLLQLGNLVLLTSQSLFAWIPSVYFIFLIIFWEGLLGGTVYVNTFASILENVHPENQEFSLGASSVGTSLGVCMAAGLSMLLEPALCRWQLDSGRKWCKIYDG